jgi:hypothetical protein
VSTVPPAVIILFLPDLMMAAGVEGLKITITEDIKRRF